MTGVGSAELLVSQAVHSTTGKPWYRTTSTRSPRPVAGSRPSYTFSSVAGPATPARVVGDHSGGMPRTGTPP